MIIDPNKFVETAEESQHDDHADINKKLQTREDVDRRVIESLEDPTNPNNIMTYDLAGKGSLKEKLTVLWKGFVSIVGFLVLAGLGKLMDEKLLHVDTGQFFSVSLVFLLGIVLVIYTKYLRYKLRRDLRRKQAATDVMTNKNDNKI